MVATIHHGGLYWIVQLKKENKKKKGKRKQKKREGFLGTIVTVSGWVLVMHPKKRMTLVNTAKANKAQQLMTTGIGTMRPVY